MKDLDKAGLDHLLSNLAVMYLSFFHKMEEKPSQRAREIEAASSWGQV